MRQGNPARQRLSWRTKNASGFAVRGRRWTTLPAIALALAMLMTTLAWADDGLAPPPVRSLIDENGVDLVSGRLQVYTGTISIGGERGLTYSRWYDSSVRDFRDNWAGTINSSGTSYTVSLFGRSVKFTLTGGTFVADATEGDGASLTFDSGANQYTFTSRNGEVAIFSKAKASDWPLQANEGQLTSLTTPTGVAITLTYSSGANPTVISVNNNLGYQLKLEALEGATRVTALNNAVDYCAPTASACSGLTQTWPSLTYAWDFETNDLTVTDALSRMTRYRFGGENSDLVSVRFPTSTSADISFSYNEQGRVEAVTKAGGSWTYSYSGVTRTVTDPLSHVRTVTINAAEQMATDTDALSRTTSYTYDSSTRRLTRVTQPEGNYTEFSYDGRGNLIQTKHVAKSGSGLSDIVSSASYDSTCANPVKCNKPNSITDALGNVTTYTYDSAHGGLLTITAPEPTSGADQPQTRYTYETRTAYYKNSAGSIVAAPSGVKLLTKISACVTGESCANAANEIKTEIVYGASGVANNLQPTAVSTGAGNGVLTATTTTAYNHLSLPVDVDGPLPGSADAVRTRYDSAGRIIGEIGPDPDGGGALKHRAVRYTYHPWGMVADVERGTVNSQSDGDWASFSSLEKVSTAHNGFGQPWKRTLIVGGVAQAVTQISYDGAGRPLCTAARLNEPAWVSLPASACDQSLFGSNTPDRIAKTVYDAAGQVGSVKTALGTAQEETVSSTYSDNGRQLTLTNGKGNVTTYEYDGFDRLKKTRYPNTTGGGSSTTDYEQYTYNAASRITLTRLRDGTEIASSFDALGRQILLDPPSTANDIAYEYDNLGRTLTVDGAAEDIEYEYDALNRTVSITGANGEVSYEYDLAGRRTKMTWPDSLYVNYDYNATGDLTAIRENNASSGLGVLAVYAYDNLGRRMSLTRGNGAVTTYDYDAVSRLEQLAHNLAGSGDDVTLTFGYNRASQIMSRTSSNSAYDWPAPSASSVSYTSNGLNQYSAVASTSYTYDGRGNLTSDGCSPSAPLRQIG